ncbi:MAG: tRNA (adenosine(37)-N6)-threonylcarbamoyltransferase complex dimerization subunit type 1 TsaB [Planctomycetota bacterium]|nr:MAG: tRNA (adenosine(37)-N6)-threonylcarbamoyltransferase complex dimerization subunit type 1 TsaB [Planctomycetota bacterium]
MDASTLRSCAALVAADGAPLGSWQQQPGRMGTAALAPAVAALLEHAGLRPAQLAGVVVGTGPGSYTGLRSVIAFGRALSLAAGLPLAGVTSLASAAAAWLDAHPECERVLTLLDARRDQSARAEYARAAPRDAAAAEAGPPALILRELSPPELVASADATPPSAPGLAVLSEPEPSALWLARLGRPRLLAGGDDPATVLPLYLKPSHAELALRERARRG